VSTRVFLASSTLFSNSTKSSNSSLYFSISSLIFFSISNLSLASSTTLTSYLAYFEAVLLSKPKPINDSAISPLAAFLIVSKLFFNSSACFLAAFNCSFNYSIPISSKLS
jgi:hypothetical protein